MANIDKETKRSHEQTSFVPRHTNPAFHSNLMEPTVYKFSSNITRKGGLKEEYFVDLTSYAKLHETHNRMLAEYATSNRSSQEINELEKQNKELQKVNEDLTQAILGLTKESKTNDVRNIDRFELQTSQKHGKMISESTAEKDNLISTQCIACESSMQIVNDPCGHVVYCNDCDKKEAMYFLAKNNGNHCLERPCSVCRQPITKTLRIYFA